MPHDPARVVADGVAHLPVGGTEVPHQSIQEAVAHGVGLGDGEPITGPIRLIPRYPVTFPKPVCDVPPATGKA